MEGAGKEKEKESEKKFFWIKFIWGPGSFLSQSIQAKFLGAAFCFFLSFSFFFWVSLGQVNQNLGGELHPSSIDFSFSFCRFLGGCLLSFLFFFVFVFWVSLGQALFTPRGRNGSPSSIFILRKKRMQPSPHLCHMQFPFPCNKTEKNSKGLQQIGRGSETTQGCPWTKKTSAQTTDPWTQTTENWDHHHQQQQQISSQSLVPNTAGDCPQDLPGPKRLQPHPKRLQIHGPGLQKTEVLKWDYQF